MKTPFINSEGEIIFPHDTKRNNTNGTHYTDTYINDSPVNSDSFESLGPLGKLEILSQTLRWLYTKATESEVALDQLKDLTSLEETMLAGFYSISIDTDHALKRAESWLEKARQHYQIDERDYQKIGD